jgi:hypothetical protein
MIILIIASFMTHKRYVIFFYKYLSACPFTYPVCSLFFNLYAYPLLVRKMEDPVTHFRFCINNI